MQKVRLSDNDLENIQLIFRKFFGENDHLWLFGSRADINKRGGDIDLYIETHEPDMSAALVKRSKFWLALQDALGEQKIDIVLNTLPCDFTLPIYKVAKTEGIILI